VSASAHRGDHDVAFYEAAIENTVGLTASAGVLTQTVDTDGPLPPGRYLVQAVGLGATQVCWVHVGPYVNGTLLTPLGPTGPGARRFPLTSTIVAIETHILRGYSDRVGVILNAGAAVSVFLSRVSTEARKA